MNSPPFSSMNNRREWFLTLARSTALFTLAAFAMWEEVKRRRLANDPNCVKLSTCSNCVEFRRCTKPKAELARSANS